MASGEWWADEMNHPAGCAAMETEACSQHSESHCVFPLGGAVEVNVLRVSVKEKS